MKMNKRWLSLFLVICLVFALAACNGEKEPEPEADAPAPQAQQDDDQGDQEDTADEAEVSEADDTETEETTEEESEPESPPVEVSEIYAEFCASCHGDKRQGNPGPPLLPENLTQDTSVYAGIIANGKGSVMPAWGNTFNEEIINSLAEWLKTPVE
jgi:mono/diheme cytochrome c family protein